MPSWNPSMPWPTSTPGGAYSRAWGGYVKLWVRAALRAGNTFHLGAHTYDRLDAGNVMGGGIPALDAAPGPESAEQRLWWDLSCDVMDVEIAGGASAAQGIFSKADTATCQVTLADPTGKYDPLNGSSDFAYGGRSRLVPGTPVQVFAEVVNGDTGAVTTHTLFTGRAETWGEDWTPRAANRRATMTASDVTRQWVQYDQPAAAAAVGAGDTTGARIARLVAYYGWTGTVEGPPSSAATHAATTFDAAGWELLNRTADNELGYVYFTPEGKLRWLNRDAWTTITPPVITLGCDALEDAGDTFHDVLTDVSPSNLDAQLRNDIYAARSGGATFHTNAQASVDRFGHYGYTRTDLTLNDDTQVLPWAQQVLQLYAFPQIQLEDATFRAAIDPRSWEVLNAALPIRYVSDIVRIVWAPPDLPENIVDGLTRVIGHSHRITRHAWETRWQLTAALALNYIGQTFHMGPHAQDRLDAGFVLALAH